MNDFYAEEQEFEIFLHKLPPLSRPVLLLHQQDKRVGTKPDTQDVSTITDINTVVEKPRLQKQNSIRHMYSWTATQLLMPYLEDTLENTMKTNTTLRKEVKNLRQQLEDMKDKKIYLQKKIKEKTPLVGDYMYTGGAKAKEEEEASVMGGENSNSTLDAISFHIQDGNITFHLL